MGRQPCCDKVGLKKGPWTAEEDKKLINFILSNGQCCWRAVPKLAGLLRCGKSCRLRWTNYLRPDLKRGLLSDHEEKLVIDLHAQLGNRWSKIASHMPGRTDNEIKNHWNTHIKKKLRKMGLDPLTHKPLSAPSTADNHPQTPKQQSEVDKMMNSIISTLENDDDEDETILNRFCTEEVPMMEPHEILLPNSTPGVEVPASSTSCSSSSSASACASGVSINNLVEDYLHFPDLDWQDSLFNDEFLGTWDVLMSDQEHVDSKQSAPDYPSLNQYQKMVFDQESSWAFGLF